MIRRFIIFKTHFVRAHDVLNVAMSTNKRTRKDIVSLAAKKSCFRDPNANINQIIHPLTSANTGTMNAVEVMESPEKAESDKKSYRVIRLSNGLKALLVSDPAPLEIQTATLEEKEAQKRMCLSVKNSSTNENTQIEASSSSEEDDDDDDEDDDDDDKGDCDSKEKQAACSLCVGVGSFSDPREVQGLAHFLEHMIFMGSEKYPNENEFDQYIKKCGGFDNADTDYEETSYYFEVQEPSLDGAMDRFSQFFKSPLMLKEAMTREREAVESEFSTRMNGEDVRRDQLLASMGDAVHPVSIFAWGNLVTLKDNVDDETLHKKVHDFWKRHYSAHRMYLCLQARMPLDDLQELVVRHFSNVPRYNYDGDDFSLFTHKNAFESKFHEKVYFVKPIGNISKIDITWCMGPILPAYRCKPHHYLSFLLGHEGKGSLLAYLRRKLWSMDLVAGIDDSGLGSNSLFSLFTICIHLTDDGFAHLKEVLEATFSYLNFLQLAGPNERLFNELKNIEETTFRFSQEREPLDNVEDLVINLKQYPPKHILNGDCLYFEYDAPAIKSLIDELNTPNFNLMVTSTHLYDSDVKYDQKEKWFGTEYSERDVPSDWKKTWENVKTFPDFTLPDENPYIADDFSISHQKSTPVPNVPTKIMDTDVCELWHRQDDRFLLPIGRYYFYFMSPSAMGTTENMVLMNLYSCILKFQLVENLYPATVAGLEYTCYTAEKGLVLKVSGYSQKLHVIVNAFAKSLKSLVYDVTEEQFEVFKEQQLKLHENIFLKPKSISKDLRLSVVDMNYIALPFKNRVLKTTTFDDFKSFCVRYLEQVKIKAVLQGNLDAKKAENIMNDVLNVLDCGKIQNKDEIEIRTAKIPVGSTYLRCRAFNANDVNTVISNFYQIGPISIRLNALIDLLIILAEEPAFDILRSKEQLGYDVSLSIRDNQGILGYIVIINSQESKFTVDYIDQRIENFRKELIDIIKNMSNEDFEQYKESLIKIKLTEDNDLKDEIQRNWAEVTMDEYIFDRAQQEVNVLRTIKQEDILQFYLDHFGEKDRKFSTQIIGNPEGNKESESEVVVDKSVFDSIQMVEFTTDCKGTLIRDIEEFKKSLEVYPVSKTRNGKE